MGRFTTTVGGSVDGSQPIRITLASSPAAFALRKRGATPQETPRKTYSKRRLRRRNRSS